MLQRRTADGLEVHCVSPADFQINRDFYCRVGRPWNWKDRLIWSEAQWKDHVQRDSLMTWVGRMDNETIGYFELESQTDGDVEIGLFGLLPQFIGRGWGGAFLSEAIVRTWDLKGTQRIWVHTCTDDHEYALANYRQRGFDVFKTEQVST